MESTDTSVIFLGGSGRSGSTLLDNVLGQLEGLVSVGEVNEIWKAGLLKNGVCGCGKPFKQCEFWHSVIETGFGALRDEDVREIVRLQGRAGRIRAIPRLIFPSLRTSQDEKDVRAYCDVYSRLLAGIVRTSGAHTVVDSSKTPAHAFMLGLLGNTSVHIVHLIRDSRAVAFSWQRIKIVDAASAEPAYMVRMNPFRSSVDWTLRNLLVAMFESAPRRGVASYDLVRYEDFTRDPRSIIARLADRVAVRAKVDEIFTSPSFVQQTRPNHTIEGNPSKLRHGGIQIQADTEWKQAMRPLDRAVVSVLTAPYLRKFGYL